MAQTKAERLAAVHETALRDFDTIQEAVRDERLQCLQDRRFYSIAGAMWEGPLGDQFENRPKFEMNKIHLAVIRIFSEYRNNRIDVIFVPKDGAPDEIADTCNGLFRADEQDCTAEEAYDNAFEEGVGGGFGALRLRTKYEDEDDDENTKQRTCIEPIFDADSSVFFDLDAKRQDKADAKRCYVLTSMTPDAYREQYDDEPSSWDKSIYQVQFDWCTPDVVYVCELYKVEESTEIIHVFRGLDDQDMMVPDFELQDDPTKADTLAATGFREVRQKKSKRRKIHKYILSGNKVLSDEGYIAGKCIPVVPFYAKRWFVDNVERCMGHVRLAKDAQRLKNMQMSTLGMLAAMSPREKPIFTPQQMAGNATMWSEDNIKEYPYMLVNPVVDENGTMQAAGPIGYTKAPSVPPAMAALLQITEQDMQDMLGNQQAGEQLQPNVSGLAVDLIQQRLDMQVFIYLSNLKKTVKRVGEVWLSMQKDIIVEDNRKMKTVDAQGETDSVTMNTPAYNSDTGEEYMQNDISGAQLDVSVEVGPASGTKRASTVRALTGMMQITDDPETKGVLGAMAMMNMEGEGISEVRDFFRKKLVQAGAIKPTDEEAQEMQQAQAGQQPDPNAVYLHAAANEADASALYKRAQTVDTLSDANLKQAQTIKTFADAGATKDQAQIATVKGMQEILAANPNIDLNAGAPAQPLGQPQPVIPPQGA